MPPPVLSRPLAANAALERAKAQFSPGDTVHFRHRNTTIQGRITPPSVRKNAGVAASDGKRYYSVPYTLLAPAEPRRTDHAATERAALERCRSLMERHGLDGWTAVLDESTSRAGACNYTRKQIQLSRLYVRKVDQAALDDTILHEIAHAPRRSAPPPRRRLEGEGTLDRLQRRPAATPNDSVRHAGSSHATPAASRARHSARRKRAVCRRCGGPITWRPWDGTTPAA